MFLVKVLRGMNGQYSIELLVVVNCMNVTLQVDQVEYFRVSDQI